MTRTTRSASGYRLSSRPSIQRAQSWRVRRSPASTWLRPVSGSTSRKICATPLRTYSSIWLHGQRLPHVADQLLVGLIHADHRPTGMVGTERLPKRSAGYKCGAAPRRDPPILLPMRLQLVFFSVRCTVITDTRSTQPRLLRPPAGAGSSASAPAGPGNRPRRQASLEHAVEDDFPRRPHPPLGSKANSSPCSQTAVSSARPCGLASAVSGTACRSARPGSMLSSALFQVDTIWCHGTQATLVMGY